MTTVRNGSMLMSHISKVIERKDSNSHFIIVKILSPFVLGSCFPIEYNVVFGVLHVKRGEGAENGIVQNIGINLTEDIFKMTSALRKTTLQLL